MATAPATKRVKHIEDANDGDHDEDNRGGDGGSDGGGEEQSGSGDRERDGDDAWSELVGWMRAQLGLRDTMVTALLNADALTARGVQLLAVHDYPKPGLITLCTVGVSTRVVHASDESGDNDGTRHYCQEFIMVARLAQLWSEDLQNYEDSVLSAVFIVVDAFLDDIDDTLTPVVDGNLVAFEWLSDDARPVPRSSRGFGGMVTTAACTDLPAAERRTLGGLPLKLVGLVPITELEAQLLASTGDDRPPQALEVLRLIDALGASAKHDLDRASVDVAQIFPGVELGSVGHARSDDENSAAVRRAVGSQAEGAWEIIPSETYDHGALHFHWEAYRGYDPDVTIFYSVGASHMTGTASTGDQHWELVLFAHTHDVVDSATGNFHDVLTRFLYAAADSYNNAFSTVRTVDAMMHCSLFHDSSYVSELGQLRLTIAACATVPPPPDFQRRRRAQNDGDASDDDPALIRLLPLTLDEYYYCVRASEETNMPRSQIVAEEFLPALSDGKVDQYDLARPSVPVAQGAYPVVRDLLRERMLALPTVLAPWVADFFKQHGVSPTDSGTLRGIRYVFQTLNRAHVDTAGRTVWEALCRFGPKAPSVNLYVATMADVSEDGLVEAILQALSKLQSAALTSVSAMPQMFGAGATPDSMPRGRYVFDASATHDDEDTRRWSALRDAYLASQPAS